MTTLQAVDRALVLALAVIAFACAFFIGVGVVLFIQWMDFR